MLNKKKIIKYKSSAGFTLIELLVAMGIFVLIAMAASWIMIRGFRYNGIIWEQLQSQNDGRRVVQNVVDDLRKAEESSVGGYPIATAGDYNLIFYANIDGDSMRERLHYWLDGTTVKQGILKPSGSPLSYSGVEDVVEIAHYVVNIEESSPLFVYYDESFTGTENALAQPVDIPDIRVIKVQLELEKDPTETPVPLHIESMVQVRNLKEN